MTGLESIAKSPNAQHPKSDPEVASKNIEKDEIQDQKIPPVNYVPELSKWERDEIDESPVVYNLSDKKVQQELKQSLPSEIIQRAEKAILLKAPKPSMLPSVPGIAKLSGDKKGNSSRSDYSNTIAKADKHNRIVYDTESIKITIPNDEKIKEHSRKRLDRSKLFERSNEPHRQSSVVVVKDNRLESRSQNFDVKDSAREKRHRHHERSSDNGRARQSHSPHHREKTSRYRENTPDYHHLSKRSDDRPSNSNKVNHKDSTNRRNDHELSSKSGLSFGNEKKLHKTKIERERSERKRLAINNELSLDKSERIESRKIKESDKKIEHIEREESERRLLNNRNPSVNDTNQSDKTESRRSTKNDKKKSHSMKEDRKSSEQTRVDSDSNSNNMKSRPLSSPSQTDSLIHDDESKFVPDYDGTSSTEDSSDGEVMDTNSSKSTNKLKKDTSDKIKLTSNEPNKLAKKRKIFRGFK
ncbi:hypothetical protein GQR58_001113 [Nymphon striatum]|nr:hypothetical protein GQR58_001113 [Nymphon striatum]